MCDICGSPNYLRCNCQSSQPFCDQCAEDSVCVEKIDSSCVIYHFGNPSAPSKLTCLGMPNGSTAEQIFERIDQLVCSQFNFPLIAVQTESIHLTLSGLANHTIEADLNISSQPGNSIQLFSDGVYVASSGETFKVKVDANAPPRYLADAVLGGTDGCVNIDINDESGFLQIQPSIDVECLVLRICADPVASANLAECLVTDIVGDICGSSLEQTLATCIVSGICEQSGTTNALAMCLLATGLFSAGSGTPFVITADNGLNINVPTNVELGGPLIKTTTIDQSGFQLNILTPNVSIGSSAAQVNQSLYVEDLTSSKKFGAFVNKGSAFQDVNLASMEVFNTFTGTTFTSGGSAGIHNDGVDAQVHVAYSGNVVLQSSDQSTYTGLYAAMSKSGAGNVSANLLTAAYFGVFAADAGNISDIASLRLAAPEQASTFGANYSGTITNFYALYFNDVNSAALSAHITNKYNIFQAGSTGLNSFSTAVVVTSDKRVKENITDFEKGLDEIEKINIVEYNTIGDDVTNRKVGVIAQDLENILPEAVKTQDRGEIKDFKVVDYNVIFSTLVNAVKELSARVKELESR
jgi:Chaperone of endosialidase